MWLTVGRNFGLRPEAGPRVNLYTVISGALLDPAAAAAFPFSANVKNVWSFASTSANAHLRIRTLEKDKKESDEEEKKKK
jgi:hypothetical protein